MPQIRGHIQTGSPSPSSPQRVPLYSSRERFRFFSSNGMPGTARVSPSVSVYLSRPRDATLSVLHHLEELLFSVADSSSGGRNVWTKKQGQLVSWLRSSSPVCPTRKCHPSILWRPFPVDPGPLLETFQGNSITLRTTLAHPDEPENKQKHGRLGETTVLYTNYRCRKK